MFAKIIGWGSIFWGVLWIWKPVFLRNRLVRKTVWYLFVTVVAVLFSIIHFFGMKAGAVGGVILIVLVWNARGLMRATVRQAVFDQVPIGAYRAIGILNVLVGCALVWLPKTVQP